MVVGMAINELATRELNDNEWIEQENLLSTNSKEDRKLRDKTMYKLLKKSVFEERKLIIKNIIV